MYIRTKNRIYEVESTLRDDGIIKGYNVGEMAFIRKDQVIDQSENLEELCDEFVLIERNAKPIIFKTLQGATNNKIYDDEIIYGAIWTDKGLIYVSKMNEDGKLELI